MRRTRLVDDRRSSHQPAFNLGTEVKLQFSQLRKAQRLYLYWLSFSPSSCIRIPRLFGTIVSRRDRGVTTCVHQIATQFLYRVPLFNNSVLFCRVWFLMMADIKYTFWNSPDVDQVPHSRDSPATTLKRPEKPDLVRGLSTTNPYRWLLNRTRSSRWV